MPVFLSKFLSRLIFPDGLTCALLVIVLLTVRRRPRAAFGAASAALMLLLMASNTWVSLLLVGLLEAHNAPDGPLPHADAIVVLSSDAGPAHPPQPAAWVDGATANRLLYAVKLYREGKSRVIILSGGQLPWTRQLPPLSASMAEVIQIMGVPPSAMIQEAGSANTYENAANVKGILKARKFRQVLLVTSAIHMPRALALFKHQGIDAIPAPCDFVSTPQAWIGATSDLEALALSAMPTADALMGTTSGLKEVIGAAVYHLAGLL